DAEGRAGQALERAAEGRGAARTGGRRKDGKSLVVVAAVEQMNAHAAVVVDGVAKDGVASGAIDDHTIATVVGNDVSGSGSRPTDHVVFHARIGAHAAECNASAVAQRDRAGDVGSDVIAFHHVVRGEVQSGPTGLVGHDDTGIPIAGDDVA